MRKPSPRPTPSTIVNRTVTLRRLPNADLREREYLSPKEVERLQRCRSPATKKGRCRLYGGASGSGGPPGERNGQYRHGERTNAAIAEQRKFSALLKMLRAGPT